MENHLCSICYENIDDNKSSYSLECNHIFHTDCIMKWFRLKNENCPLCNSNEIDTTNLKYGIKLECIKEIKKLYKKKNCPIKLAKQIEKIKKAEIRRKDYDKEFRLFKQEYKDLILKYKNYRSKSWQKYCKVKEEENKLLALVELEPIYIIDNN